MRAAAPSFLRTTEYRARDRGFVCQKSALFRVICAHRGIEHRLLIGMKLGSIEYDVVPPYRDSGSCDEGSTLEISHCKMAETPYKLYQSCVYVLVNLSFAL